MQKTSQRHSVKRATTKSVRNALAYEYEPMYKIIRRNKQNRVNRVRKWRYAIRRPKYRPTE